MGQIKKISLLMALVAGISFPACAQQSVESLLSAIERNNPGLQANREMNTALKLEARTGNTLDNPSVNLEYMFGSPRTEGNEYELTVVQSFDFPSAYVQKGKIASLKSEQYDTRHRIYRQDVLLEAKLTAFELIYLRRHGEFLDKRYQNARDLSKMYEKRMEDGDANILEYNKIQIEFLNVDTEKRLNDTAIRTALEKLQALNGGVPVEFTGLEYPAEPTDLGFDRVLASALEKSPEIRNLDSDISIAGKEISLSRSLALPKFDLGYKRSADNLSSSSFNGFIVGMSLPVFESRNTVKRAKAQAVFADTQKKSETQLFSTNLKKLYQEAETLKETVEQYQKLLKANHSVDLLNTALEEGEISALEYFVEVALLYQSIESFLKIEQDYHATLARLYKFDL